jgi:hypothetical protein
MLCGSLSIGSETEALPYLFRHLPSWDQHDQDQEPVRRASQIIADDTPP